ncbi:zinc ABC transporter substrate-binding protein [candidate division WWE3 bacterium]|uniref:Zinc ABC transporter substrate-binding protein n=1 Tax=candidate division WWE3 bacterium TaxID=2053526 RepID=A0A955LVV1_UNCKA|nr:zinc ABC transporter substrate-binding protein [candidate division WWE3 bacterium]
MLNNKNGFITVVLLAIVVIGISLVLLIPYLRSLDSNNSTGPKVATTIYPLYDIVRNVAGENVETVLLLPPGASPHTFDPSPGDLQEIAGSDTVFMIGHGLDDWTADIATSAGVDSLKVVDTNIILMENEEDGHHDHEDDESHDEVDHEDDHDHGPINPHYWLSIPNAILITQTVSEELSQLYPELSGTFKTNADEYIATLSDLQTEFELSLTGASPQIATFHNAWGYFAESLDIEIVTTFEEYAGQEPSASYLAEFQEHIEEHQVTVIFAEPQLSTNALEPIAADLGATISILDPLGGVEGRETFVDLMRYNVSQIVATI